MKMRVLLTTTASTWADVEIPEDFSEEEYGMTAKDWAADNAMPNASLCHHCAGALYLGDFELPEDHSEDDVEVVE
jgi:hypothetical protein